MNEMKFNDSAPAQDDDRRSAAETKLETKQQMLETLSAQLGGEITYIGRLALAIPDSQNWLMVVDENNQVIKQKHLARLRLELRAIRAAEEF
ncbi:MAG TPA: hypothetical protein VFW90_00540 [Candidatus Saccharimonadales bacterium]|nr:hypothetical protein [Candidatus Saccharimonadales bacterium]